MKVLVELRPALDGNAGIPQEVRLLFAGLCRLPELKVEGLIQSGGRVLAPALTAEEAAHLQADERVNRLSRVVVSLHPPAGTATLDKLADLWRRSMAPVALVLRHVLRRPLSLGHFDATHYKDFIWRSMFSRTLPEADFEAVTNAGFRVASIPWSLMHGTALYTRWLGHAIYPRMDTRDFDVVIVETPYPAMASPGTRLVVRYHDAVPMLMPHTISNRSFHQSSHYLALRLNVAQGAHFACVSNATRADLLAMFPHLEQRSTTIYNMVSHHYFPEDSSVVRIPEIIHARRYRGLDADTHPWPSPQSMFGVPVRETPCAFLLMVSTIEPRKNHGTLLEAWGELRKHGFPALKLVLVGSLGWDHASIMAEIRPWIERGEAFLLHDVPAPELRALYRHARATICPSFGEGFNYSGVEAMRSGGAVVASDIPVHREVFGEAAQYFNPYSMADATRSIAMVIDPANDERRLQLIQAGEPISRRYLPENILPQWQALLDRLPS